MQITRDTIMAHKACEDGVGAFDAAYPGGVMEYDPTSHEDAARILGGPIAEYWGWGVSEGIAEPFRLSAGYRGTASAGYRGTATAGYGGTASAGHGGTALAGDRGTASAGYRGTATAGYGGTASAGEWGTITIERWDESRRRFVVGYISETLDASGAVLAPNVKYKLDNKGAFVRAEEE